jgi:hypothetical protein
MRSVPFCLSCDLIICPVPFWQFDYCLALHNMSVQSAWNHCDIFTVNFQQPSVCVCVGQTAILQLFSLNLVHKSVSWPESIFSNILLMVFGFTMLKAMCSINKLFLLKHFEVNACINIFLIGHPRTVISLCHTRWLTFYKSFAIVWYQNIFAWMCWCLIYVVWAER